MSHLPLSTYSPESGTTNNIMMMELSSAPVTFTAIQSYSLKDPIICKVIDLIKANEKYVEESAEFKPYIARINELSVEDGRLLWGHRIVIPTPLRQTVLADLHHAHPGMTRMKSLARSYVWWPVIDGELETVVQKCSPCQEHQNIPRTAPIHPWEHQNIPRSAPIHPWEHQNIPRTAPIHPWEHPSKSRTRLHVDYAGPYHGKMYLIIVDSYSGLTCFP